ncbi:TIGR04219 family outer membrane beta-barrel protein [Gilvimarinus xylanilyticus]|uniref:TIGR04219 family outer membrane beta-barrel protein n=1 Tax=Gilvimarinus xylanilyticus TaxID=2944139 RepID=A0A9X2I208_9GAMM|nr:TIGR04219 family outer membrane beta-barrel protein [Gilvimarinus xylanilyticus]MCP8898865.1 TIGR04219 family outer membrane beta-barrel protein [Gilvimarinus xylanilyticus]
MDLRIALALLLTLPLTSFADDYTVSGKAGLWRVDYSGELNGANTHDLGFDDETSRFIDVAVQHAYPKFPYVRLAYTQIDSTRAVRLDPVTVSDAKIDLSHIDATAYYRVLDSWGRIDLGLSLRYINGGLNTDTATQEQHTHINQLLPMAYARLESDLPFVGWRAGVELSGTDFQDYKIVDYTVYARYLFDAVLDLGLDVGYRNFAFEADKGAGSDLGMRGPYAGLAFAF